MTTLDLEPKDEIDGPLSDTKELLRAAIILIDGLSADDSNLPQNIITAATEKIEQALTNQPAHWPAA